MLHPGVAEGDGEALGASLVHGQGWRTPTSLDSSISIVLSAARVLVVTPVFSARRRVRA